ncbi:LysE family translocator [Sporomusa sp.]|uniref:LysE family translocator n=1 Tax=Sporomusa sp. TaxID=2078658 RepID=UPI002C7DFC1C|nr:LysE family translocator [Sporomusa sp.]HWR10149.1 LysE family translocator [Sporomusa sp.]
MSISPGPVNITTLSAGVNYGFRSSFPFVSGATIGFIVLLITIGLGISNLVDQFNVLYEILRYAGAGFIGYTGYKIIISTPEIKSEDTKLPGFYHGFLMQWLNPKAWIACLSGVSAFNLRDSYYMLFIFVGIYFVICYFSLAAWALLGSKVQFFLKVRERIKLFNLSMGGSLIIVALYLLLAEHRSSLLSLSVELIP